MVNAYVSGDPVKAMKLHHELFPIFRGMFNCPHRVPNPAPVKHALNLNGIQVGSLRLPMIPVNEAEGLFIENLLRQG
ncbi:4-hydroxy-tetrahydrodipicolinate synthase [compost metagenome]